MKEKYPLTAAIIQARMGSTRLPGKVLADISGKTLLEHVIQRVSASKLIKQTILATTTNEKDKALIEFARARGLKYYAGSENDVLDRFYQAAKKYNVTTIVRITPDDPFKDPEVIDKLITHYLEKQGAVDYVSNTIKPTYPEGLDAEVFSFKALEKAWREAKKPSEREHVTPYIWNHPELFKLVNVENDTDLSGLRWTVDTEADLKFAREVYARLYHGQVFLMKEILALLKAEPELSKINAGMIRNAGYLKSLKLEEPKK
jgi:spore coat polysaccharide biosynthesis protein SpsF (cytidylyltransferase family)